MDRWGQAWSAEVRHGQPRLLDNHLEISYWIRSSCAPKTDLNPGGEQAQAILMVGSKRGATPLGWIPNIFMHMISFIQTKFKRL